VDKEYDFDEDPDIFQVIVEEMRDDGDAQPQTSKFLDWYGNSDDATKEAIDITLTHICGWSLRTLVKKARGEAHT